MYPLSEVSKNKNFLLLGFQEESTNVWWLRRIQFPFQIEKFIKKYAAPHFFTEFLTWLMAMKWL